MKRRGAGSTQGKPQEPPKASDSTKSAGRYSHATDASVAGKWYLPIFVAIAFLLPLAVYLQTLNCGMAGGDWGELVVNAYQFSVPHPPGYPTFMALGWFWIHVVPLPGSVAFRINVLSAVESAAAASFLFLAICELIVSLTNKKPSLITLATALFGSLLYSFSSIVWTYSLHAEVFPLNNFFCAALLFLTFRYLRTKNVNHAIWGAFVCGFALTNQHTLVVFEAMIIPWILYSGRKELFTSRRLTQLAVAFMVGFSPYLLLFISQSIHNAKYSWGDLLSISGTITHLTRAEYGSFQLYKGDSDNDDSNPPYFLKLKFYFSNLIFSELGIAASIFALIGVIFSFSSRRRQLYSVPLIACFLFYITWFFDRCNLPLGDALFLGVWYRFFPQLNMLVAIWAATGLYAISQYVKQRGIAPSLLAKAVVFAVIAVSVGAQLSSNFSTLDQSDNHYIEEYGKAILEPLPNNSIVLLKGDLECNTANYLHLVEGIRPDLTLLSVNHMTYSWWEERHIPLYPHITWPGKFYHPFKPGGFSVSQFMEQNIDKYPIMVISGWKPGDDSWKDESKWYIARYGIGERVFRASSMKGAGKTDEERKLKRAEKIYRVTKWPEQFDSLQFAPHSKYDASSWELRLIELVTSSRCNLAYQLLMVATELSGFEGAPIYSQMLVPTVRLLEQAAAEVSNMTWVPAVKRLQTYEHTYRNLGIAYDYAHKHLIAAQADSWNGFTRKQIIQHVVIAWDKHLNLYPNDKAIRDAVNYWRQKM